MWDTSRAGPGEGEGSWCVSSGGSQQSPLWFWGSTWCRLPWAQPHSRSEPFPWVSTFQGTCSNFDAMSKTEQIPSISCLRPILPEALGLACVSFLVQLDGGRLTGAAGGAGRGELCDVSSASAWIREVFPSSVDKSHKSGHKTERPGHVSAVTQLTSACWGGTWSVCLSSTTAWALLQRGQRLGEVWRGGSCVVTVLVLTNDRIG